MMYSCCLDACALYTSVSFFCNISVFIVDPEDQNVEINDTNVELVCTPGLDMEQEITWQIFLRNGTFLSVTGSDEDAQRRR